MKTNTFMGLLCVAPSLLAFGFDPVSPLECRHVFKVQTCVLSKCSDASYQLAAFMWEAKSLHIELGFFFVLLWMHVGLAPAFPG